jgi:cell division protein FtsI/penicillin-binding protein 2
MTQQRARETRRVWLPAAFFAAFALVILGRLIELQVIDHGRYALAAKNELLGSDTVFARRGSILDRNGNALAESVDTWDIYVNSRSWKDDGPANTASEALAKALRLNAAELRARVRQSKAIDVLIGRDIDYEVGKRIIHDGIAGVVALPNTARVNPEGDLGGSILGFIGQDNSGLAGIEAAYNDTLQGKPGKAIYERDSTGEPIPFGQHIATNPEPGKDLVLTIDRYIQLEAERRLDQAIKDHKAQGGAIVVMDPSTGEILALATKPGLTYSTLNLNDPSQMELFRNRAVSDLYEPGSVMKVITAASAIDLGVVSPDTTYVDSGVVHIYETDIRNWDFQTYGTQTMTGVLQNSINTGAIFMVEKLGATAFQRYLDAFGFGKTTGIDLTGEAEGIFRRPNDPGWSPVDLATQSFGQSISVTPIQMTTAVAAAINGGNLVRPHLVKAIIGADGKRQDVKPEILGRAISAESSATMRQMLRDVVMPPERGYPGKPRNYTAGGKSGTANVPVAGHYDDHQVASFIGFAPGDDPKILVMVKIDQNQDLMTGTQAASPIFARFADDILGYMNVRPDAARFASSR